MGDVAHLALSSNGWISSSDNLAFSNLDNLIKILERSATGERKWSYCVVFHVQMLNTRSVRTIVQTICNIVCERLSFRRALLQRLRAQKLLVTGFVKFAIDHNDIQFVMVLQNCNVFDRITINKYAVGIEARFDLAKFISCMNDLATPAVAATIDSMGVKSSNLTKCSRSRAYVP